jgi:hypothetical protein
MPPNKKFKPEMAMMPVEYAGTVSPHFIDVAEKNAMNDGTIVSARNESTGTPFSMREHTAKDLKATSQYLQGQGRIGEADHLRAEGAKIVGADEVLNWY